jgi:hypothetical protein
MSQFDFRSIIVADSVKRYQRDLSAWENKIRRIHQPLDALRVAGFAPSPGALIRSLRSVTNADTARTRANVERILTQKLEDVGGNDPQLLLMTRMAQGHWPRLHITLSDRLAKAHDLDTAEPDFGGM